MENTGRLQAKLEDVSFRNSGNGFHQRPTHQAGISSFKYSAPRPFQFQMNTRNPSHGTSNFPEADMFRDEDTPLDAFDKELLSELPGEYEWQAEQGLAKLPSYRDPTTPADRNLRSDKLRDDLLDVPSQNHSSSSSPPSLISSHTLSTVQNEFAWSKRHDTGQGHSSYRSQVPPKAIPLGSKHAPPLIQGITLVPTVKLPDRFRAIFPFALFNAVQSKCFSIAYQGDENLVLSAPTGSGKTVVMELAICQLMTSSPKSDFKVVYQAPTKSLCAERYRDWHAKFGALDLQCAELTGDTEFNQLRSVQSASIIITTPEKWDSVTRKWKDNVRLMELVKLFLIDEVHILKEARGATLEAVVSRMKSVGSKIRFIALSATVPNSEDIATWLGRSSELPNSPAHREVFGEEFRPVQLQKFVQGYSFNSNDFAFDNMLADRVPDVIARYSMKKSVMIFCGTRRAAVHMAKVLAKVWAAANADSKLWSIPSEQVRVMDTELMELTAAGVAFHHGGLDVTDRRSIEQGFLTGNISIICSTSTLAVGVNLPCYLVIIKGTTGWTDQGAQEYTDLEIMQMLGRAGRPQFESSACAVILTRNHQIQRYERMVSGEDILESCLHQNLIDHLNAEIALGTVQDLTSAKRWLAGTFLFVRLKKNPGRYRLGEGLPDQNEDDLLERVCQKDIKLLQENDLISKQVPLKGTELGDAMARYYVKFETMKTLRSLPPKAKTSEILSVLAQATEFRDIRLKAGEKSLYKEFNQENGIKFPIKVDIALPAHKVSLLIQTELGGSSYPVDDQYKKHKSQYLTDKSMVFSHVNRLIRCVIDCQVHVRDSVSARHALELGRSLAARVWDNSSLQLKQIEGVGDVMVRKLAADGINSIEALERTEPHRIELLFRRNPPFGRNLLGKVAEFPSLRVTVKQTGRECEPGNWVRIKFQVDIGFLNGTLPQYFRRKPVYVCLLAETSDGQVIDFRRFGAKKLQNGQEIHLSVELFKPTICINCHVMCDEVAGTSRYAELSLHEIPTSWFPQVDPRQAKVGRQPHGDFEEFADGGLVDDDFLAVELSHEEIYVVEDIDDIVSDGDSISKSRKLSHRRSVSQISITDEDGEPAFREPVQLPNGRWACNHTCNDKTPNKCKHKCCREGVAKPRKQLKKSSIKQNQDTSSNAINEHTTHPKKATKSINEVNEIFKKTANRAKLYAHGLGSFDRQHEASRTSGSRLAGPRKVHKNLIENFDEFDGDVLDLTEEYPQLQPYSKVTLAHLNRKSETQVADQLIDAPEQRETDRSAESLGTSRHFTPPELFEAVPTDFLDSDVDLGGFETPLSNVNMGKFNKLDALPPNKEIAKRSYGGTHEKNILPATQSSSSGKISASRPTDEKRKDMENFCHQSSIYSTTDNVTDPDEGIPPPYKRIRWEDKTPERDLKKACIVTVGVIETPNAIPGEQVSEEDTKWGVESAKERLKQLEAEEQKKKWEGIDTEMYEMFKDCVELE